MKKHTASSAESDCSLSVPAATIPPSWPSASFPEPWRRFLVLNLYVGRELMDSDVAPLVLFVSSLKPMTDIMQGRQQHIIAQRMKGMAYPMQLKVRNTIHNLAGSNVSNKRLGQCLIHRRKLFCLYLYKFGASAEEERPPNIHTFPTTNQTAKKQSNAILKWSNRALILQMAGAFSFQHRCKMHKYTERTMKFVFTLDNSSAPNCNHKLYKKLLTCEKLAYYISWQ
jgi:hypothetical protein